MKHLRVLENLIHGVDGSTWDCIVIQQLHPLVPRRRRAWRADHAESGSRRHYAGRACRAHRGGTSAVFAGLPYRVRQLALDALAREHRAVAGHLPQAQSGGPHLFQTGRAVLRSGQDHVPRRPLHQGRMPEVRRQDQYGDACEVCGSVYTPTDLKNPYSTLSGAAPVLKSSEHYFFKLSDTKCVEFIKKWLNKPGRLQPQVANKAKEWLEGKGDRAFGDWDISRDAPYFGIPIPDAPGKYFYVWLDAPIGYLASFKNYCAKKGIDFDKFLADPDTEQIHFIGKDIIYFHTLFWPAMLHFAGKPYKDPDQINVHGFITVSGEKMSKSRGTGISPLRYLEVGMNPEWLRYYIAAKLNASVEDLDFNPDDFMARVNSDLVGKYVNIASRCAGFINREFDGKLYNSDLAN